MKNTVVAIINCLIVAGVFGCCPPSAMAAGESATVTATLDVKQPGALISTNFAGLSFEASLLLPDKSGLRYFRPDNLPLIQLFHTLGIKSLRIGGNTSDRDAIQLPGPADWDSLFGFAKVAQVKVIYCLQLYHGDPQVAVRTVKYMTDHYARWMDAFSIGQEPGAYPVNTIAPRLANGRKGPAAEKYTYPAYAQEWKRFADAIIAAVPTVKFCGPGVHDDSRWAREFISDFGRSNHVALITEHLYPGGAGGTVPTAKIGRDRMLGDGFVKIYQKLYDGFAPLAASNDLQYRLEEVNNFYNGGATNVSNTFASALWGLDFMYWWAEHGATGLNFHTGDRVAAGSTLLPSRYTAFLSTADGFAVRPLGYGIKAFELGGHGRVVPVTVEKANNFDLSIHAVLGEDRNLYVTVINKDNGANATNTDLVVRLNSHRFTSATMISLVAPGHDIAASQGQTLGGAEIGDDGSWNGKWTAMNSSPQNSLDCGIFSLEIPPAFACVIRLTTLPSIAFPGKPANGAFRDANIGMAVPLIGNKQQRPIK